MHAARLTQSAPSSVITLEVLSFGLYNNEGERGTSYLQIGFVANPSLPFQDGDAFETVTWTSDAASGIATNLSIGLGGQVPSGSPPTDPNPRVQFTPDPASIAHLTNSYLGIPYSVWAGPAWLKLYFEGGNMVCEWWDNPNFTGQPVLRDTFAAAPGPPYAAFATGPTGLGPNGQSGAAYLGEWKVSGGPARTAPYPFAQQQGVLIGGPGAAGSVRIS